MVPERESAQGMFRFVSHLGKWSMLDVFVVAILVILMRSGGVADIAIRDGVVLFTCSVLLTQTGAVLTGRTVRGLKQD
jgi:paraquat-inducible protein A